jgi:hypothetical protein
MVTSAQTSLAITIAQATLTVTELILTPNRIMSKLIIAHMKLQSGLITPIKLQIGPITPMQLTIILMRRIALSRATTLPAQMAITATFMIAMTPVVITPARSPTITPLGKCKWRPAPKILFAKTPAPMRTVATPPMQRCAGLRTVAIIAANSTVRSGSSKMIRGTVISAPRSQAKCLRKIGSVLKISSTLPN